MIIKVAEQEIDDVWSDVVDQIDFKDYPAEPADRDYPGAPAYCEYWAKQSIVIEWEVGKVLLEDYIHLIWGKQHEVMGVHPKTKEGLRLVFQHNDYRVDNEAKTVVVVYELIDIKSTGEFAS